MDNTTDFYPNSFDDVKPVNQYLKENTALFSKSLSQSEISNIFRMWHNWKIHLIHHDKSILDKINTNYASPINTFLTQKANLVMRYCDESALPPEIMQKVKFWILETVREKEIWDKITDYETFQLYSILDIDWDQVTLKDKNDTFTIRFLKQTDWYDIIYNDIIYEIWKWRSDNLTKHWKNLEWTVQESYTSRTNSWLFTSADLAYNLNTAKLHDHIWETKLWDAIWWQYKTEKRKNLERNYETEWINNLYWTNDVPLLRNILISIAIDYDKKWSFKLCETTEFMLDSTWTRKRIQWWAQGYQPHQLVLDPLTYCSQLLLDWWEVKFPASWNKIKLSEDPYIKKFIDENIDDFRSSATYSEENSQTIDKQSRYLRDPSKTASKDIEKLKRNLDKLYEIANS